MAVKPIPNAIDAVIVGNGPSALILSYILHGNIPYYSPVTPHPDPILHKKLSESPCLLGINVQDLTAHFSASRLSYSTQALPINVVLDTLLRPLADTDPGKYETCVEWCFEKERQVGHVVLGNTAQAGGQWADNPVSASWDISTLSYAEMLSLPGYSFEDHYKKAHGRQISNFTRPSRREVAAYLATYPEVVGIDDSIYTREEVQGVRRADEGFHIGSHNITCKHLVLASGTFSTLIPPRPALQPLKGLPDPNPACDAPLLVIGSGFTAADIIISTAPSRKIVHIFKWNPENHPSPLRACHPKAYPEYANIYRRMKLAAQGALGSQGATSPIRTKKSNTLSERDWDGVYEGFPNTYIRDVEVHDTWGLVGLETPSGIIVQREISNMEYVIGRRGSLGYLDESIVTDIGVVQDQIPINKALISGNNLRSRVEWSLELIPSVFVVGSLTGDSLIRFAYGACIFAAREIMRPSSSRSGLSDNTPSNSSLSLSTAPSSPSNLQACDQGAAISATEHSDLHLDKRFRSYTGAEEVERCKMWPDSLWWCRGCVIS